MTGGLTAGSALRMTSAVLVNGEPANCLSSHDRGLLYGDGVFETLAVSGAQPRFWRRHVRRLQEGCRRLLIPFPEADRLLDEARRLIAGSESCVLKLIITRGPGGHGYRTPPDVQPTRILQLLPWPGSVPVHGEVSGAAVCLCKQRLGINPVLAGIKHLNRLEQVLARQEWDDPDIHEGLLRDPSGHVIEGTMSNLFVVKGSTLLTPDLTRCGVAGVMRSVVMDLAERLAVETVVREIRLVELEAGDELFLTNSLIGIRPIVRLEDAAYREGPVTRQLRAVFAELKSEGEAWYP